MLNAERERERERPSVIYEIRNRDIKILFEDSWRDYESSRDTEEVGSDIR